MFTHDMCICILIQSMQSQHSHFPTFKTHMFPHPIFSMYENISYRRTPQAPNPNRYSYLKQSIIIELQTNDNNSDRFNIVYQSITHRIIYIQTYRFVFLSHQSSIIIITPPYTQMQTQDKKSVRLTNIGGGQPLTAQQLYTGIFKLSLKSFGNQHMQIDNFSQTIVRDYRWVTTSQINQIKNLCWALPGPTLYQMIITVSTLKLQSPMAGFLAFIVFNIPCWIFLFVLGKIVDVYANDLQVTQVKLAFLGFNAATAGVMVRGLVQYFKQNSSRIPMIIIMTLTTLIFWLWRTSSSIVFCLIAGAIFSLYIQIQTKNQMSTRSQNLFHRIHGNLLLGKNSIYLFIGIFVVLWILCSQYSNQWFNFTYIYYFAGSLVVGPASSVFAYLYAFFKEIDFISEELFWVGYPFAYIIPGSVVNGTLYYAVLVDGLRGLIISSICFYLPSFISLFGILPNWKYYRSKAGVQRLTKGLTCVSTGLMTAMLFISLQHCAQIDVSMTFTIFIVSIFLNYVWGYYSFLIVLIGGLLANVRRWGLIYYRLLPDHPY